MLKERCTCKKCKSVTYRDLDIQDITISHSEALQPMNAIFIYENKCENCKSTSCKSEIVDMDKEDIPVEEAAE